ncbi:MAG: pyridoxamine 5'-phosphate oxidase family protein [Candidatus Hermodarchaeota archaeon]
MCAKTSQEIALKFLQSHSFLTMATSSKTGVPNATPHEYGVQGTNVFLEISKEHVSVTNIRENPVVHFEIHDIFTPETAQNAKVLQILAEAEIHYPDSVQFDGYWEKLTHQFPYMKAFPKETRVILVFQSKEGMLIEFSKTKLQRTFLNFS